MELLKQGTGALYQAPGHFSIAMRRLTGDGAATSGFARLMHLHYDADGYVEHSASADEKIYICLSGQVEISNGSDSFLLDPGDLCIVAPNEPRKISNRATQGSELFLIMPRQ